MTGNKHAIYANFRHDEGIGKDLTAFPYALSVSWLRPVIGRLMGRGSFPGVLVMFVAGLGKDLIAFPYALSVSRLRLVIGRLMGRGSFPGVLDALEIISENVSHPGTVSLSKKW